jgi:dihydrofolate reductase
MSKLLEPLAMIAAYARNRVIGCRGQIPWYSREDLLHFRQITMTHAVITGRHTAESIGKPLTGRRNIALSRSPVNIQGYEMCNSLPDAIQLARQRDACPIIIGGASLYEQALPLATILYLTHIDIDIAGDTFFPDIPTQQWQEIHRHIIDNLCFSTWLRRY